MLVAIDHFSRKIVAVNPLDGPNAAWVCDALEQAFRVFGPPKHIITDQQGVFTGGALHEQLGRWDVSHRLGAIGKHGSIAVTERAIQTLKYEWLRRVALVRGIDHLTSLCAEFGEWYNRWRPHQTIEGATPDDFYRRDRPDPVDRDAKVVPLNIERRTFSEVGVTGFRLRDAA